RPVRGFNHCCLSKGAEWLATPTDRLHQTRQHMLGVGQTHVGFERAHADAVAVAHAAPLRSPPDTSRQTGAVPRCDHRAAGADIPNHLSKLLVVEIENGIE